MAEAIEGQQRLAVEKLLRQVQAGDLGQYKGRAEELLNDVDSVTLLSAALKLMTKEPDVTPVKISAEAPLRTRSFAAHRGKPAEKGPFAPKAKPRSKAWTY